MIDQGIAKAKPIVEHWWRESARPAIDATRASLRERRVRKAQWDGAVIEGTVGELAQESTTAPEVDRPNMSAAEAQARYLAALAARAYSEEQVRLVTNANIVDGEGLAELKRSLAELPSDEVKALIEEMVINPSML